MSNEKMHSLQPNARRTSAAGLWMSLALVAAATAALSAAASAQSIQSITFAKDIVKPGEQIPATVTLSQPVTKNTQVEFTTWPSEAQSNVLTVPWNAIVQAGNTSRGFQIVVPNNSPGGCVRVVGKLPPSPTGHTSWRSIIVDPAPVSNAVRLGALRAGVGQTTDTGGDARRFAQIYGAYIEIRGSVHLSQKYMDPVEIYFSSVPQRTWTTANPIVIQPGSQVARFTIRTDYVETDARTIDNRVCTLLQANAVVRPTRPGVRPQVLPGAQVYTEIMWVSPGG